MSERQKLSVIAPIPPELRAHLAKNYDLVEERPNPGDTLSGYQVAVTTSVVGIDAAVMAALPDLKLVTCNGAGLDKIDLVAAEKSGIKIQHTPDAVTHDTADTAISLMYATVRRVAEADRFVRSGAWKTQRMTPSRRISSLKLGIVGLGKIGSEVARRAATICAEVLYTGPREKPQAPYQYEADIIRLAQQVDVLVLTCPPSPQTNGLVDKNLLEALGPEGYLINISRGSVVNEQELIQALENKTISGAGLDVFDNEPNIDARFFALENAVLQPHYAAVTTETRLDMANVISSAIDLFFQNQAH